MRWSAEKLRWILLTGVLLLACGLAAILGMANYRAGKIWQRILARNGVNLKQETDGFTYSQSDGKRTIFTLHAAKAVPHGKGRWSLSNAVLVLYSKDGRTDRIYGSQFDYDQEAGVARAVGEVHMDLQAPPTKTKSGKPAAAADLSFTPGEDDAANPALIHVRTSGLVYTRKLGVAATKERTEFRYGALMCTSRGAEFDSGQNLLRLLAEVEMEGTLREKPFRLTAAHADLDRSTDEADLLRPVLVSEDRNGRADHAVMHLRSGGSLQTGDADGAVELRVGTQQVRAPRLHGDFDTENRLQHALLSGGVQFADSDARRPSVGSAEALDLGMTPAGMLRTATAAGAVNLLAKTVVAEGPGSSRQMRAARAVAEFAPTAKEARRSQLRSLRLTGAAEVVSDSAALGVGVSAPRELTRVAADELLTTFTPVDRTPQPVLLTGVGNTRLERSVGDGTRQLSTGENLRVQFAQRLSSRLNGAGSLEVASATQTGAVVLRAWNAAAGEAKGLPTAGVGIPIADTGVPTAGGSLSVGHAQQAVYEAAQGTLTLTGAGDARADVYDGTTQLFAPSIVLHEGTGNGEASGGVVATTGGDNDEPATHVIAGRAVLLHGAGLSQFFGTDAQPARLWQGGSQVRAARLALDGAHHALSARPEARGGIVHAVFANGRATAKQGVAKPARTDAGRGFGLGGGRALDDGVASAASRDAVEVRAAAMDYDDRTREATFSGGVRVTGADGEIAGSHGAAFLAPPASPSVPAEEARTPGTAGLGGRLERFAILGDVRLTQPGRTGAGGQLTYTASTNSYALTGSGAEMPHIRDAAQGLVTGTTLVFGAADSSIVVAGAPPAKDSPGQVAGKPVKPARVHTETDLKQQ